MPGSITTRALLRAGVIGPIGFVFLLEGATRPGYDATGQFVSVLSLGEGGWLPRAPTAGAPTWAAYSLISGVVMVGGWLATFVLKGPSGTLAMAGLLQRVAVIAGFQWIAATALIELRRIGRAAIPAYA